MSDISSAKAARAAEAEKEKKASRKYAVTVWAIVAVVVLLVIFVVLFSSNLFYNTTDAVDIGGYGFSAADFNFNYYNVYVSYCNNIYNMYGSYSGLEDLMNSMLPSTSTPLSQQAYPGGSEGIETWADYFEDAALQRMQRVAMLCSEAEKAGVGPTDEQLATLEENVASMREQAETSGFPSLNSYLARLYGKGMNEKVYRENLRREAVATTYSQYVSDNLTYTQEQKDAYYNEHRDEYDILVYRSVFFSGAAVTDDESTEEDETLSAEDALKKAEEDSGAFLAKVTDEQSFIDAAAELHAGEDGYDADSATLTEAMGSDLGSAFKDWLLSSDRAPGQAAVLKTPDDAGTQGYYVIYFINRDNNQYHATSGYYGLVANATDNVDRSAFETDEDYDLAVEQLTTLNASTVLNSYTTSATHDLETFQQVMSDNSDLLSESGTLDRTGIYDLPDEVGAWMHDPARVPGDTEKIYVPDYGCFILYFTSDDGVYADLVAETNLRNTDYTNWEEETLKSYTVDTEWEMRFTKKLPSLGE